MPDSLDDARFDASSPTPGSATIAVSGDDASRLADRRSRVAVKLALLGIPTFGITAIAGFGLGLAGLGDRPRGRSVVAIVASILILVGWIGGLAGAIEAMRIRLGTPGHIFSAERVLAGELVARLLPGIDPADPRPPSITALREALKTVPDRFRRYGDPPEALAVEPSPVLPGTIACWWIAPPADPGLGSAVTEVVRESGRTGRFLFAADGREVWSFKRMFAATTNWDDREASILAATRPAAEAIVAAAMDREGVLPDALEAAEIIQSLGPGPHPSYRPRPGGIFDLVVPGGRDHATFAAFGGVLVPIRPNG